MAHAPIPLRSATVSMPGTPFSITNGGAGGYFESGTGAAVEGYSTNGNGVYGSTEKATGTGVYGAAWSSTGLNYGVFGLSNSNQGFGGFFDEDASTGTTYGVYSRSFSTSGIGALGLAAATSGTNYGVQGKSSSTSGRGVHGEATAVSGTTYGVVGDASASSSGYGGSFKGGYIGVYGLASGSSGSNYGVYAQTNSASGYAGYFVGNVTVTGTLSKGAGSFKIDHPLDPANKYLSHSFVESPDMMNIYNGNAKLNDNGEAWIELPEWFSALNKDFRYQLTCIGGPAPVYIATEIENNRFQIAGGTPGLKVSWQVTGIRHDAYAEQHRIRVEEPKPEGERGTYLHPEAFSEKEN